MTDINKVKEAKELLQDKEAVRQLKKKKPQRIDEFLIWVAQHDRDNSWPCQLRKLVVLHVSVMFVLGCFHALIQAPLVSLLSVAMLGVLYAFYLRKSYAQYVVEQEVGVTLEVEEPII